MTNFREFETVLAAANTELNNLKAKSKEIQNEIDTINQDRYEKVYTYFSEMLKLMQRNNICTNTLYIPTHIKISDSYYIVLKVCQGFNDRMTVHYPSLGIHTTNIKDYFGNSSDDYGWIRWMNIKPSYQDTLKGVKGDRNGLVSSLEDLLIELVDHFDEYEPVISANFKEAVTRQMAEKLDDTAAELKHKAIVLMNK